MKLELKYLSPYLPYDLKGFCTDDLQGVEIMNGLQKISDNCIEVISDKEPMDLVYFKPILFPLSLLTKEITINDETFVPIKNLFELHHCGMRIKEKLQCFSFDKNKIKYDDFNCAITDGVYMFGYSNYGGFQAIDTDEYKNYTVINQLELLMKLFEWKFDVFELIEAGLAEPVTEDFNPYK